jgi:hypothetical protein
VAQHHPGPESWLPPVRRDHIVPIMTTNPTTTITLEPRPAETTLYKAIPASSSPATKPSRQLGRRTIANCAAVARRTYSLVLRYRVELAPAGAIGSVTGLGWAQHLAGAGLGTVAAYTGLGVLSAAVAGIGLRSGHEKVLGAGAALTIVFGDIATATGAGIGATSLTAAAISSGIAYAGYVPWLVRHRKDSKPAVAPATTPEVNTTDASAIEPPAIDITNTPFYADAIPYSDDHSTNIADPIRIGWDEHGQPVHLTLLYRHTLVAGASDFGKSGVVNLIIKKLLRKKHVELYGIDMKPGAPELGPWAPKMRRLATTPEDARDLLQSIRAECDRRGAFLADLSAREMAAGRGPVRKWIPGVHGTAIVVVTDELAELIRQDEELRKLEAEAAKYDEDAGPAEQKVSVTYESLLAIARFLAIQFVSATQQPSAKVFGGNTDARGNYANRLSTRVSDADHAQFVFGKSWKSSGFDPSRLSRPGEIFLAAADMPQSSPARIRVEYVTDLDIAADVAHLHGTVPAQPLGRFAPQGQTRMHLVKQAEPPKPAGPPAPTYPDGSTVPRREWPDLYRVFEALCAEEGCATKETLTERGPFESRDTVRRALQVWLDHGVQVRKAGRTEEFYLPAVD